MVWGTLSSSTRKYSFFRPGIKAPSLESTPTSTVTSWEATRMEKLSSPSTFLGALGASSFGGGSSFFLGTAIGPMSPCGPPASAGALALGVGVGVAVGLAWACPLCACATGMDSHKPAMRTSAARKRKQAVALEIGSGLTACIKSILHCLFLRFYFCIDSPNQLF